MHSNFSPRFTGLILACCFSAPLAAQHGEQDAAPPRSLQQLTEAADLVLVAQVLDTDYVYARNFPTRGSAYLRPLIRYKVTQAIEDIIEVFEQGLHAGECYFENPSVVEEGRRFLLFLIQDPDAPGRYRGLSQGCAIEILVSNDNSYALRMPASGMAVSDNLKKLATPIEFADSYALVNEEDLSAATRDELLKTGFLEAQDQQYRYTQGVSLSEIRRLMGPQAITRDRSLKR
jgi:hypothetical protein